MDRPRGMDPGECRSCKAPIYWVRTHNDRPMPVDRGAGSGIVMRDGVAYVERVYQSHFTSCPNSKQHRSPRG